MFRKKRRPTPEFQIPPPFNPISGEFGDLDNNGIYPYCAMVQVALDDIYDDYVVCRGFDPRIQKFINYGGEGSESLGISVAKPFGHRGTSKYSVGKGSARRFRVGEIFPAFLPTQGTASFTPPSPSSVHWRVGQNPGVANDAQDYAGQPSSLSDTVSSLYDHNNKAINWMLVHSDNDRHFRFQSAQNLTGTSCQACVRQMDGSNAHMSTIFDPDRIFLGMQAGTKGLVFFQDGNYYIVQAKCNPDQIQACV
jgi:hypothetical protein